jgi:predicted ATPase
MRQDLPSGHPTLLFTDVEESTKLLHELGAKAYAEALAEHRQVVRAACSAHGGVEVDTQGDAFFVAFPTASGAVEAARTMTERLDPGRIRIRIGLHTGSPLVTDEGYVGDDVHFAARVAASAHGGQVVLSHATRALVAKEHQLTDLGEHRLKDIEDPVSIFQLGTDAFPPLKTISNTNLPRPASSFVGREAELQEVLALIEQGARLVTLTGPGGSGKTRLALEAATTLVPEYKAGVFWVGLSALRDPALVPEAISQTLGAKDGLAEHIGERELLLLLDNLEQVIEVAPDLSALLSSCPNLTFLVTSRELLRVQGEVEYPVPPLERSEAVFLFCERSGLDPDDTVAELCARLDSLPLAVELAAARVKALSPAQILERLSQRLDLLKGGRDADPRQQTLRATIEWSYDLLSEEEQQLFARLSVFAGGCTLEAAEEVAAADLDTLQSLVEKSLVRFTASDAGSRYWMLETVREYAGERLAKGGEAEELAQRHVRHFLALAETAEPELWAQQTGAWLARLDPEEANFRAALAWIIKRDDAEVAVRLAGSLYPFWEIRARHGEARAWLNRTLALGGAVPLSCRAKALVAAGRATSWQFDWPAAITLLEEGAELCRKLDDLEGVGRCLGFIAHARLFTGDSAGAAVALNEGVELARSTGDRRSLARALYNAAFAPIEERNFDRASDMFEEAAGIARAEGMKLSLALSLIHLGYTAVLAGDFERAASRLNEGVDLFDDLGETTWTPVAYLYLGLRALLGGEIEEAESILRTSLMEGREQAPQQQLADWIEALAAVATAKGEALRAATLWGATDALFEKRGLAVLEVNRQVRERFRHEADGSLQSDSRAEAWDKGHAMTLQQAVAYALAEDP